MTHSTPDIFDSEARKQYQQGTWKRSDTPVEVITRESFGFKQWRFRDLAHAQETFPHLTLGQGMRGCWRDEVEYVLRFEEYTL